MTHPVSSNLGADVNQSCFNSGQTDETADEGLRVERSKISYLEQIDPDEASWCLRRIWHDVTFLNLDVLSASDTLKMRIGLS